MTSTGDGSNRDGDRLVVASAVLLAILIAGHRWIPNVAGFGSLIDTAAPLLAAGVPPLALAALACRSRRALAAVALPAAIWLAVFGPAWVPSGGGAVQLRVASQNLRADNPDPAGTVAPLASQADLIGLQEISATALGPVEQALTPTHRYRAVVSTVALFSRFPILTYAGVDTGLDWIRALRAEVATPDADVVVYVVHLGSARAGDTASRDRSLAGLVAALRQDPAERLVVLGDLNTASTDRVIAPLTELVRDAHADAGRGFGFTWPSPLPVTRPDHVLYRGLVAAAAGVVRTPGSDHRAVTAGFRV
ncbi:MAG TPA: endonuclease/exonuclease/phosphatase family protein [Micromonosporaceae bacterium]